MKAYSLVELVVVLAIIAILAVVAVPAYNSYLKKAAVMKVFDDLNLLKRNLNEYYITNGVYPASIIYGGATLNANTNTNVSLPTINLIGYFINTTSTYQSYWIQARADLNALGISFDPATECISTNCKVFIAGFTNRISGITNFYCGPWNVNDLGSIPFQYLPASCDCAIANISGGNPNC